MTKLASLTIREKVAQLIFPRIGSNLPPVCSVSEDAERVAKLMAQAPIGGLCLFNGHWPETRVALATLQAQSQYPLLVAADLERGAGQQVRGMTIFPHAMAWAGDDDLTSGALSVGLCSRLTAQQALAAGIHIVLSPVADVNSDPRNPIISTRAFSTNTGIASAMVAASVRGIQSGGGIACAKHFPGHGNTIEDSHDAFPVVDSDQSTLMSRDLPPFQAAIQAGVKVIMTAHVSYPGLDASGTPATVSMPILTDLLRHQLGFDGVIMTDSLLMSAVRDRFENECLLAEAALLAGADVLLDVEDPLMVIDGLCRQIEQSDELRDRVERASERVWKLKTEQFGELTSATGTVPTDTTAVTDVPGQAAAEAAARQIAESAIREFGEASCRQQLQPDQSVGLLVLKPFDARWDLPEQPIVGELRERLGKLTAWQHSPASPDTAIDDIQSAAMQCDQLAIVMIVKPAAWHRFGLMPEQERLVKQLMQHPALSLVSLGVPFVLEDFSECPRRVCAWSDVAVSQHAMARYLTHGS